jgi:glycosyltransferase involved in cell wall biosynthesis
MLSVLIPVYQVAVKNLVEELLTQCRNLKIPFEIICLDDGSIDSIRKLNQNLPAIASEITYEELSANVGRSKIRNELVKRAHFEWLWFLDCDSDARPNPSLAATFWGQKKNHTLLSGGRIYQTDPPFNAQLLLHWLWGSQRELLDPQKRMNDPVNAFLSNNFLVQKTVLAEINFNETLQGYGYEDTLFAFELVNSGITIQHIANPVLHDGLEAAPDFLSKIEESLNNLKLLSEICAQKKIDFPVKSKLMKTVTLLNLPVLRGISKGVFNNKLKTWKESLLGNHPSLNLFDLYRLGYLFMKLNEEHKKVSN